MFSKRFKSLRKERKLSQSAIAEILDLSQATIASWELGSRNPKFEDITKIADYFNVSVDYLLGVETEKETANPDGSADHASIYSRLTPENQKKADSYLDFLLTSQGKQDT